MKTVREVSQITGVSVRTLHHYDAIGLLKPSQVTQAGYRLYDGEALRRLQNILMFRELRFPLKEIKAILDSPHFDPQEALEQQIHLLELERKRIEELIFYAREIQEKGVDYMKPDKFSRQEIEAYAQEVKERWGGTQEYQEFEQKTKGKTAGEQNRMGRELMELLAEIGALRTEKSAESAEVQEKIQGVQGFITEHYYTCTKEVLRGLGEMYVCDQRMKENIDRAGGEGSAEFIRQAIEVYCRG